MVKWKIGLLLTVHYVTLTALILHTGGIAKDVELERKNAEVLYNISVIEKTVEKQRVYYTQLAKEKQRQEEEKKKEKSTKEKSTKEKSTKEESTQEKNIQEESIQEESIQEESNIVQPEWNGEILTAEKGAIYGPSGKETYYNLPMEGVVSIMRSMGNTDKYWIREDGVKMLGDYIMVACDFSIRPRGSYVETSLGTGIVCDTGSFTETNSTLVDIAVNW